MIVRKMLSISEGTKRLSRALAKAQRSFSMLALLVLVIAAMAANPVAAQEKLYFSIPQTSADVALKSYAQQSGRQVLYPFDVVAAYQSNAIEGYFNADEALFKLFRNTGLLAYADDKNNLVVRVATEEEIEMPNNKKSFWGFATAIAALFSGHSVAQDSNAQNSAARYGLEEVVVTARKVEENLQIVPIAISSFSAETLERRQINGTDDLGKITPNLQFTNNAPLAGNNNSSVIFIRGVGQVSARANTDPGVGLYIDDVYMGQSVGGSMELRDIVGVQVLRGPQGTLFGRNTIGGAVLLATAEPGDEVGGKFRIGTGDDSLITAFGAIDLPISDTFRTRFTLGVKKQDGYVTRRFDGTDLGDVDNTTFTAKAVLEPTDNFTAKLSFDYTEADENGSAMVFADYNNNTVINYYGPGNAAWIGANQSVAAGCPEAWVVPAGGPPTRPIETAPGATITVPATIGVGGPPVGYVAEINDPRCANNFQDAGPYANNGTNPLSSTLENKGMALNLSWDLSESLVLKSITSYRELDWTGIRDADNTPLTILHTDYDSSGDQLSQEFQLTYQSERMTAVAGLYYYEEEIDDVLTVSVGDKPSGFNCGPGTDRCHLDSDNNITDNESKAAYGQVTFDLSDSVSATLGVRRTEETKASIPEQFDWIDSINGNPDTVNATQTAAQAAGTAPGFGDFYLEPRRYEEDFSATTVSANVSWSITDTSMVYASYSEGFKGGGWNSSFNFPLFDSDLAAGHMFNQEEVETIELGFKSDLTDTLRVNGAIFSSDYTDLQFTYRVFIAPWFFNAGKASIDGAELELTWIPSERWIVESGIGYLDSSIDETATIAVPGRPVNSSVAVGNQLPFSPELKWNLGIGYSAEMDNFLISPRVDISYSDKVFFDAANTVPIAQTDSYTTVDLSFAVENLSAAWKVVLGINNATDETYRVSGNSSLGSGTGYAETAYARPRMWFANFTRNF